MDIKIMLWYDVEDYITPQADDALLSLIDMMDKMGVISSLKFVGDKARAIRDRGRFDIIRKLSGHEICYHTDNHSRHPTVSEYLAGYGFADGAKEFERREARGFWDTADITGQFPASYGQPGASWAPQVYPALRKWGVPTYLDSHDIIDLNDMPFWYGGVLNITKLYSTMRLDLIEDEEKALSEAKAAFDKLCETKKSGEEKTKFISIYYHPCEFSGTKFWDGINFMGKNTPACDWKLSPLHPPGKMEELVGRLGKFIGYTLKRDNVEYITSSRTVGCELRPNAKTSAEDIRDFAGRAENGKVNYAKLGGRWYCASEILSLMERYLSKRHLTANLSYGPEKHEKSKIGGKLKVRELTHAAREQYSLVFGYRQLPDLYKTSAGLLNPPDMFCALSAAIAQNLNEDDELEVTRGAGLAPAALVKDKTDWGGDWIFPERLDASNLVNMAKLQTWTIRPFDL